MKIKDAKRVHIIGIGGIGISALARMLHHRGIEISGTNDSESPETLDGLRAHGVEIVTMNKDTAVQLPEADVYVYSVAWESRAPRVLEEARATGKRVITYFEALGEIAREYKVIAISGTHGKTTTTAMTAQALIASGLNPTVIVGSMVNWPDSGELSNFRPGGEEAVPQLAKQSGAMGGAASLLNDKPLLVVEACEYKRHFLNFNPYILAITNIELDHTDYYKDLADIEDAFAELASQSEIVLATDSMQNQILAVPELKVPGEHNRQNAALALAVVDALGADKEMAKKALADFAGTWRRFEYKGKTERGALVYDDYAHHPTALRAAISGARERYKDAKIFAVFESHTYSRTHSLMHEFGQALAHADEVIVAPIYPAREEPIPGVDHHALGNSVTDAGGSVQVAESLQEAAHLASQQAGEGDVILLLGAGDLYAQAEKIVSKKV